MPNNPSTTMRTSSSGGAQVAGQPSLADAHIAKGVMAPNISSASKQPSDVARLRSVRDAWPKLQSLAKGFMSPTFSSASKQSSRQSSTTVEMIPDSGSRRSGSARPKLQSPAAKGFMAKTIFSPSKFKPPPRKKAFVEAIRNSILMSKPASKKVTFLDTHQESKKSIISYPNSSKINTSNSSIFPSVAPLNAKSSLPPYDPKTNYLSPRPRFLSHIPNPRVEVLLKKEKKMDFDELKTLEEDDDDSYMKDSEREKWEDIEMVTKFKADEDSEKEKLKNLASVIVEGLNLSEHDLNVSRGSNDMLIRCSLAQRLSWSLRRDTNAPYESMMMTDLRKIGLAPVYLNVYDLTPINNYAYGLGLGVYHSGVQVDGDGEEYSFGLANEDKTGVFRVKPKRCPGFRFRKSIMIGGTDLSLTEVKLLMEEMEWKYWGNTYNMVSKNCNHFSNDVCIRLTGKSIPKWVNRLARLGNHFLCVSG